jgi:hypothetical protein
MVAKVIVNPSSGKVPVRIANFTEKSITLFKDTTTAILESVTVVDKQNVCNTKVNNTKGIQNNQKLPDHLSDMFKKSAENLDPDQTEVLRNFLIKHQNVFSRDSNDIGHSSLVKHSIDTGNAKPVKNIHTEFL